MPLEPAEQHIVDARRAAIEETIGTLHNHPWPIRTRAAALQLDAIHGDWWGRYTAAPRSYADDLARVNELAGWEGPFAAVTHVARNGTTYLAPPKFFGGNVARLAEQFVLAVSLNHATPSTDKYLLELADLQARETCLVAHRDYFRQGYVHGRFFKPRATVLNAYAEGLGLDAPETWCMVNERFSLYLERYPTLSANCKGARAPHAVLEAESFVMALNGLTHEVVLRLLRPRAILLAGQPTWGLLPAAGPVDVSARIRPSQDPKCRVTVDHLGLGAGTPPATVVRCNFLKTVHGPNSNAELARLGGLLAS